MWVNGSTDLEGVHGAITVLDLKQASLCSRLPRFQPNKRDRRPSPTCL